MPRPYIAHLASATQLALTASLGALVACGSPPPPAAPVTLPASSASAAPAPPPIDTSPAPEPPGLIAFARAAKPSEAIKVVGGWVQMPMPGPSEVGQLITGEPTGNLVDLDQPIDFAIVMRGPQPRGAMSAAVRSLDEARLAFSKYKLVPGENGALHIEGLGKPDDADKDGDEGEARVCELLPSFGPAAMRIVCAESQRTLDELGPWLARTVPRSTYPSDLHVELRVSPIRELVSTMRRALPMLAGSALGIRHTGVPEIDDAFRATIEDLADLSSDADTVSIDAMFGEPQATVTMTSRFRSSTSLLARLAVSHPERAGAPPAAFWKLPADADVAFFYGGIDAADFEHLRDHLADIVGASLTKLGLADADRKAMRDVAAETLDLVALRSEYAKGLDLDAAEKAIAAIKTVKEGDAAARDEAERAAAERMAGWLVVGLDAPAAKVGAIEKEWAAAWARPGVAKWVRAKATDSPPPVIRMAPLPKGITGKDAAHLEMVVYPTHSGRVPDTSGGAKTAKKAVPGKPLILHALVVPDGNASWLVFAADEALAVAKAKEVMGAGALASRAGLASMKDARMNGGGFVTARSFELQDVFGWVLSPSWWRLEHDPLRWIASAPDQGATPILFQLASQPGATASPAGSFTATATIPKGAIESIVRMAMH
jgi:hypothetical protein